MITLKDVSIDIFNNGNKTNLTIDEGEILGIVGADGSGKTSLLKIFAGISNYTGSIQIEGRDLADIEKSERTKIISHNIDLTAGNPDETLENFLILSRLPFKKRFSPYSEYDRDACERYAAELGLSGLLKTPSGRISSSPLQKAIVCFAMIREARILLLDEPSARLGISSAADLARTLSKYTSAGNRSVAVASNDLNFVLQTADRIAFMQNGAVAVLSKPEDINSEVIKKYFGIDTFITRNVYNGRPAVHFFPET